MNYIVTGATGFIGQHLCRKLLSLEDTKHLTMIDKSPAAPTEFVSDPRVCFVSLDIAAPFDAEAIPHQSYGSNPAPVVQIFHLAALARIQPSFGRPHDYYLTNVMGTVWVCELARHAGASLVYAMTSSSLSGVHHSPYTSSKHLGQEVIKTYTHCYGVHASTCMFFNVYGPQENDSGSYGTVVGRFLRQYHEGLPLTVVGDGQQSRDFTHVHDVCDGMIAAGQMIMPCEKETGEPCAQDEDMRTAVDLWLLGTGTSVTISDLVGYFPKGTPMERVPLRRNEAEHTRAKNTFTKLSLHWEPHISLCDYIFKQTDQT